jgi:hypothetical protein
MPTERWLFLFAALQALGVILVFFRVDVRVFKGLHLSAWPTDLRQRIMFVLSVGSLVLSVYGFHRSFGEQPQTIVQFDEAFTFGRLTIFEPETPTALNIFIQNFGPTYARNVAWCGGVVVATKPGSEITEEQIFQDFKRDCKTIGASDLTVGAQTFGTYSTRRLSVIDIADINDGKMRLYLTVRIKYEDGNGTHVAEACRYLQPQPRPEMANRALIWHTCVAHNHIQ